MNGSRFPACLPRAALLCAVSLLACEGTRVWAQVVRDRPEPGQKNERNEAAPRVVPALPETSGEWDLESLDRALKVQVDLGLRWYATTPPGDRMIWGGLFACAGLGLGVLIERMLLLRRRRIIPGEFTARFLDRLHEGKLDGGKALDYCEMNPSPAARVALAAVRRWGRPAVDLERAVSLAHRVEAERLRRNVGTLRRIAALAPLLGLLGSLLAIGRVLEAVPASPTLSWGPAIARTLWPMTVGVALATLALVAFDGLWIRIERLTGALDRLGAETIDAIAMTAAPVSPTIGLTARIPRSGSAPTASPLGVPAQLPHQTYRQREEHGAESSRMPEHDIGY